MKQNEGYKRKSYKQTKFLQSWKIYDYVAYQNYRFSVRECRWQMKSDTIDESISEPLQTVDMMCFSSQFYMMTTLGTSGIMFFIVSIEMMMRAEYNMFGDPAFPPLFAFISWLDVGVSVFDPVYHQPVLLSKRYGVHDIVSHADWADMLRFEVLSKREDGSPEVMGVTHDHALLDAYVEDGVTKTVAAAPPPMLREWALRRSPYSLYS